jgi:hypothetical protein
MTMRSPGHGRTMHMGMFATFRNGLLALLCLCGIQHSASLSRIGALHPVMPLRTSLRGGGGDHGVPVAQSSPNTKLQAEQVRCWYSIESCVVFVRVLAKVSFCSAEACRRYTKVKFAML